MYITLFILFFALFYISRQDSASGISIDYSNCYIICCNQSLCYHFYLFHIF